MTRIMHHRRPAHCASAPMRRAHFEPANLARALQGLVRIRGRGKASRGDCVRLAKLFGKDAAIAFWRQAMSEAP